VSTVSSSTSSTSTSYVKSENSSNGTVSFSGISSGVDTAALVDQLIEAERSGTDTRIANSTAEINADISALGKVSDALSTLQTASDALDSDSTGNARTTSVDDGAGFSASAEAGAAVGSYEIEVTQLAQSHKLTSAAYESDATIGSGTLTISAGGSSVEVEVDADDTLSDIAEAINNAAGSEIVVASTISTDDGERLVLTAAQSGEDNALTVTSSDSSLAALTYPATTTESGSTGMSQTTAAQDAILKIDGYTKTSSSNSVDDVLQGVTLELESVTTGSSYTLEISSDTSTISDALTEFVDAYNNLMTVLDEVSAYNLDSDGALAGDSLIRNLKNQVRSSISDNTVELSTLGITIEQESGQIGTMELDTDVLNTALRENPSAVGNVFSSKDSNSLGSSLNTVYDTMIDDSDGLIPQREDTLEAKLVDLEQQSEDLDERMTTLRATYEAEFVAMEKTMSEMETTSSYLDQYLNTDDDDDDD
jgi:flagellar hook-associated protein 2